uniref:Uncharacterized protein n=1 Tax=Plectus sambesii TaxID=2011161 RepID=A0A914UVP6_9BILA
MGKDVGVSSVIQRPGGSQTVDRIYVTDDSAENGATVCGNRGSRGPKPVLGDSVSCAPPDTECHRAARCTRASDTRRSAYGPITTSHLLLPPIAIRLPRHSPPRTSERAPNG